MSNQTFLYTTETPRKPLHGACPQKGQLLMAAMSIPVFWYMLFDKTCLVLGPGADEADTPYHHLTTTTADGLSRANARWPSVSRVLGRTLTPLFQCWLSFVQAKADAYLHCETAELFWFDENTDKFARELRAYLSAFDHIPKRSQSGVKLNKWWEQLLGQAHVGIRDGKLEPLGNLSYCGFAYQYEVPWDDGNNAGCGCLRAKAPLPSTVGKEPNDIRKYLEADQIRHGILIDEFRLATCPCGSQVFRLLYDPKEEVVQRICTLCGKEKVCCQSEEFWEDTKPVEWRCKQCGSNQANLGAGFSLDDDEKLVLYVTIGQRCVQCGLLERSLGWEAFESPLTLLDDV